MDLNVSGTAVSLSSLWILTQACVCKAEVSALLQLHTTIVHSTQVLVDVQFRTLNPSKHALTVF